MTLSVTFNQSFALAHGAIALLAVVALFYHYRPSDGYRLRPVDLIGAWTLVLSAAFANLVAFDAI